MRQLRSSDLESFLAAKPVAVIHFDAEWDLTYGPILRAKMLDAETIFGERVSFGEIDIDHNEKLVKSMRILNVPAIAYYREGKLVAALIGVRQSVRSRVQRVLAGEPMGYKDDTDDRS